MQEFRNEIRKTPTEDLLVILKDQRDLYTQEERTIIKQELASRTDDPLFRNTILEKKRQDEERKKQIEAQEHAKRKEAEREMFRSHLMTTGFNFEGYDIQKYVGVISEEVVLGTGFISEFSASISDFFGGASNTFSRKLKAAKEAATEKLIGASISKGGNAIIGVEFDYITFANNMIGVVASGTAVQIKKK